MATANNVVTHLYDTYDHATSVVRDLEAAGIPTAVHYPLPIHVQPAYTHLSRPDDCPVALDMATKVLSLPMGPYFDHESIRRVAGVLLEALDCKSALGVSEAA